MGPGLPLILAVGSDPLAPAALLLTPFFLGASVGGPIGACEGVPAAAGVPGLDGEALSPFDTAGAWSLGTVVEGAGESFAGDSSFMDAGSRTLRSLTDGTRRVTTDEVFPEDFRRSFSLLEAEALLGVGIATIRDFVEDELRYGVGVGEAIRRMRKGGG